MQSSSLPCNLDKIFNFLPVQRPQSVCLRVTCGPTNSVLLVDCLYDHIEGGFPKRLPDSSFKETSLVTVDNISSFKSFRFAKPNKCGKYKVHRTHADARMGLKSLLRPFILASASHCGIEQNVTALAIHCWSAVLSHNKLPLLSECRSHSP